MIGVVSFSEPFDQLLSLEPLIELNALVVAIDQERLLAVHRAAMAYEDMEVEHVLVTLFLLLSFFHVCFHTLLVRRVG